MSDRIVTGPFRKLRLINGHMAYGQFQPAFTGEPPGHLVAFVDVKDESVVPATSVIQAFKGAAEEPSS